MWDTLILNPMINTLLWIYSVIGNFGIAIIIFTILVRLLTHPLTLQQMKGQAKMTEFQQSKEYQDLQAKYKDDKQKLQAEQAKLIQQMGINPFASCLPTLIQFPIIIGLYQAIIRALAVTPVQMLDLVGHVYPFFNAAPLIPINKQFLWMDLSQPDRVYILGFGIPVMAILVVITTYVQAKVMTPPASMDKQAASMTQSMNLVMPVMMGMFALQFAAGLAVYFVASNLVSIGQYAAMGKVNWSALIPGKKPAAIEKPKPASKSGERKLPERRSKTK
jgi:YidC/Oxa1 family membrane protein insertase